MVWNEPVRDAKRNYRTHISTGPIREWKPGAARSRLLDLRGPSVADTALG